VTKINTSTPSNTIAPIKPKPAISQIKNDTKKVEKKVPIVEQKEEVTPPVNPEPVKKFKWYQKLFNWFKYNFQIFSP